MHAHFTTAQLKKEGTTRLQAEVAACLPSGSTDLARLSASEVARSVLAGVTARMRQVSLEMNCMIMSLICASMSTGWSPTGILVRPGRSISVMFSTANRRENKRDHSLLLLSRWEWAETCRGKRKELNNSADGEGRRDSNSVRDRDVYGLYSNIKKRKENM